ncbi:MAG TPA: hypothetical protein VIJ96_01445 [Acidothermaceae bacterium]
MPALANVSSASVALSRTAAGANSNYTIAFTTTSTVAAGRTVTLVQAGGTTFSLSAADYTVDGTTVTAVTATTNGVISHWPLPAPRSAPQRCLRPTSRTLRRPS